MSLRQFHLSCHKGVSRLPRMRRGEAGDVLVDALVSVLVSALLGTALVQMYSQVHKMGNQSQAQFVAASVAQAAIDHLRSLSYNFVLANAGTHTPQVNGAGNGDILFPRALLQDSSTFVGSGGSNTSLDYTGGGNVEVSQGVNNVLQTCDPNSKQITNTINVVISPQGSGNNTACLVTVTVVFIDGSGGTRTYTITSMLTNNGLNG